MTVRNALVKKMRIDPEEILNKVPPLKTVFSTRKLLRDSEITIMGGFLGRLGTEAERNPS